MAVAMVIVAKAKAFNEKIGDLQWRFKLQTLSSQVPRKKKH
jgi:hypothetical protein